MVSKSKKLIVILGPTASGKTKLAVKLAIQFNGEIVSADSRQVYKGMDIGTGKDLKEYEIIKNGKKIKVPYHLIDMVSPKSQFSLAKYQKMAYRAIDDIIKRGKTPFLAGGTGLYIQAVVEGINLSEVKPAKKLREELEKWDNKKVFEKLKSMDPALANTADKGNKRRMIRYIEIMENTKKTITELWESQEKNQKYDCLLLGIYPSGKEKGSQGLLNKKIDNRLKKRLKEGMIEEVKNLHHAGISWKRLESFGLEYKFISQYLQKKLEYANMANLLKIASHQYAKRQMTWFKRDKRIIWSAETREIKNIIRLFLENQNNSKK